MVDTVDADSDRSGPDEWPPADADAVHFVEVENGGRGLQAAGGATREAPWTIRYRISNPTEPSVYLVGCNNPPRPQLQKWMGGEWRPVHYVIDSACRSPAWEIEPGETLPTAPDWDVVEVTYEPGTHPGTEGDTSLRGTYRLVIGLFTGDPDVDLSSATQIAGTSTQFEVE